MKRRLTVLDSQGPVSKLGHNRVFELSLLGIDTDSHNKIRFFFYWS